MIEYAVLFTFGAFLLFYITVLSFLLYQFSIFIRKSERKENSNQEVRFPFVSIIVSARNEEKNLPRLLPCLTSQEYPPDKLEIIIVDDRSEDKTWEIIAEAEKQYENLIGIQIQNLLPDFAPKKRAIDKAVHQARGEILLLTDADCTPPSTWVRTMVSYYGEDVVAVLGYSPYRYDTKVPQFLQGILSLDNFSLAAVAVSSVAMGIPLTATGTNLSYRREAFFAINGFESMKSWVSGDDDLLVHAIRRKKLGVFDYAIDEGAHVPAAATQSWKQFWHQRIRYASKGKKYDKPMLIGLLAVLLLNIGIAAGIFSGVWGFSTFFKVALMFWVAKSFFEFSYLYTIARYFKQSHLLIYFIPTAVLHSFYVALFGSLGLLGAFRWKGGKYRQTAPRRDTISK